MKIYLAAPYAARNSMRGITGMLEAEGHDVTSQWIWATHEIHTGVVDAAPEHADEYLRVQTADDLADIDRAEAVILFTSGWVIANCSLEKSQTTSGGRHIETGYALAKGKRVIVLGEPENIFHRGACLLAEDLHDVLCLLFDDNEEEPTT